MQAVREIYEIVPSRKWKDDENRINKVVFIGIELFLITFSLCHVYLATVADPRQEIFFFFFFFRSIAK